MRELYRTIRNVGLIGLTSLFLLYNGCKREKETSQGTTKRRATEVDESLKSVKESLKSLEELFPKSQITPLAEKVLNLACELFSLEYDSFSSPRVGAIYLGKDEQGNKEYATIKAKKEGLEELDISLYKWLNRETEEKVDKYLSTRASSKSAADELSKEKEQITIFDFCPVTGSFELGDIVYLQTEERELIEVRAEEMSKDSLKRVNEIYTALLEKAALILENESVAQKKKGEELIKAWEAERKKGEEETRPDRLKALENTLKDLNF